MSFAWSIYDFRACRTLFDGSAETKFAEVTVRKWPWSTAERKLIYRTEGDGWRWHYEENSCPIIVDWLESQIGVSYGI